MCQDISVTTTVTALQIPSARILYFSPVNVMHKIQGCDRMLNFQTQLLEQIHCVL